VRSGSGPEAPAAARNTAVTPARRQGFDDIAAACRHFMANRPEAVSLIRYGRIKWPWGGPKPAGLLRNGELGSARQSWK